MNSTTSLWFYSSEQKSYALTYSIAMVSLSLLLALFGKFYTVFNTIDSIAMIFFLFFTSSNYPANVIDFSKLFGRFHYDFMYDFVSKYLSTDKISVNSPTPFTNNGFNGFFLSNTSISCNFIGGFLALYILVKVASWLPASSFQLWIKFKVLISWEYDWFIYVLWIFYHQFGVFALIQIKQGISLNQTSEIISFMILLFSGIIMCVSPILSFYKIYQKRTEFSLSGPPKYNQIMYLSLLKGLKINYVRQEQELVLSKDSKRKSKLSFFDIMGAPSQFSHTEDILSEAKKMYTLTEQKRFSKYCKFTNVILLFRKATFICVIILLQSNVRVQMGIICAYNLILFYHYFTTKPYVYRMDTFRSALLEILFFVLQCLICLFDKSLSFVSSSSTQIKLGWIYILVSIIILIIGLLALTQKLYIVISQKLNQKSVKQQKSKVAPNQVSIYTDSVKGPMFNSSIGESKRYSELTQISTPQNKKSILIAPSPISNVKEEETPKPTIPNTPIIQQKKETPIYPTFRVQPQQNIQSESSLGDTKTDTSHSFMPKRFENLTGNSSNHKIEFSENQRSRKDRVKKLLFKRNPFIPKDEEILFEKERSNETHTTIGGQNSSFILI